MKFSRYGNAIYVNQFRGTLFLFLFPVFTKTGSHLYFHAVSSVVPSAAFVLTIVFGMLNGCFPKAHRHRNSSQKL